MDNELQQEESLFNQVQLPMLKSWGDDKWRSSAACKGKDTNMFFPVRSEVEEELQGMTKDQRVRARKKIKETTGVGTYVPHTQISEARLICVSCTVRKNCLEFAITNNIKHGMYGGRSPKDRRGLTVENLDASIPLSEILRDLHRVRKEAGRVTNVNLADDLAKIIGVTVNYATSLLKSNDRSKRF